MTQDILDILHALVDAVFKAGSVTDAAAADLHGKIDAQSPPAAGTPGPDAEAAGDPTDG